MATWIYKCNARNAPHQVSYGDWDDFFAEPGDGEWGSTEWTPELRKAQPSDTILAYQTDRNEFVGIAKVIRQRKRGAYYDLILRPVEEIRVKLRPLKKRYSSISSIPALQPGPIHTLYSVAAADARRLLRAARSTYRVDIDDIARQAEQSVSGGGFGTAEENRKVEAAAIKHVCEYFHEHDYAVRDVSATKCGYDLECRREAQSRSSFSRATKNALGSLIGISDSLLLPTLLVARHFFSFAGRVPSVEFILSQWLMCAHSQRPPNHAVELTATRRVSTLRVASSLFVFATRAPGRRSSPCSR